MNYKNCYKVMRRLIIVGLLLIACAYLLHSLFLCLVGFACIVICTPIQITYWRCPYCRTPLPYSMPKKGPYLYRCTCCGAELDIWGKK